MEGGKKKMRSIKIIFLVIVLIVLCVIPTMALGTGSISVISNPPGAQIWIDDNLQGGGDDFIPFVTPYTFDGVSEGTHRVKVHLAGYKLEDQQWVDVTAGQTTTAEFQLAPSNGPSMKIVSSTTNTQTFPRDLITFLVYLSPLDIGSTAGATRVMWNLGVYWDTRYLKLVYYDDNCGPTPVNEDWTTYYCEDAAWRPIDDEWVKLGNPLLLAFEVLESTPYRTKTIVNFLGSFGEWGGNDQRDLEKSVTVSIPEYPSPYIPAIAIIGFLGAVLLIKRTREN
jgi:hypothetical protein